MKRTLLGALCATVLMGPLAQAQGYWLAPGDQRLRDDLTLLADEGVLRLPLMTWPVPVADVREALERVNEDSVSTAALQLALDRVRGRVAVPVNAEDWVVRETSASIGRAPLLRDFGSLAREDGELRSTGGTSNDRWGATVSLTAVLHAQDGKTLRVDNSDITVRWGNWLFSANTHDRWWGPGQAGSLILSTNARPMANLSVDRQRSTPFNLPVLRWLGPWRASAFVGQAEHTRQDFTGSLFLGTRVTFSPVPILELGLSRTAQFCGSSTTIPRPPCGLKTILRSLTGTDNPSKDVSRAEEPGNQMAGYEARLVSPFKPVPMALYAQFIGEDATHRMPLRFLAQYGLEGWTQFESGASLRGQVEYASTSCKQTTPEPGCAYINSLFGGGYQFLGRVIGHTTDADSQTFAVALRLLQADGEQWSFLGRKGQLNRFGAANYYSSVAPLPSQISSAEVGWRVLVQGIDIAVVAGYEHRSTAVGPNRDGPYGFIRWQKRL